MTEKPPSFIDFDFIPAPILVVEEGGSITFANSSAARFLGYKRGDLLGMPWQVLLPDWHLKAYRRLLERYLSPAGGEEPPRTLRTHISRRDGGQNAVEITLRPLRLSGWSGVLNLVHERRPARNASVEGALVPSVEKGLLKASMDGVLLMSATGRFEECNDACCDMLGYTRADLLSLNLRSLEPPDGPARLARRLHEAAKTGQQRITATLRRGDGSRVQVELSAAFTCQGARHIACSMREAGGPRQAEESLRESERRFTELVESLPQVVFEADPRGLITFVNDAAYAAFGYERGMLEKGITVFETVAVGDRAKAVENFGRVLAGERPGPCGYMAARTDGSTFDALVYSSPIVRDGSTAGVRGVLVDISELKKTEKRVRQLSAVVEQSPVSVIITDAEANIEYVNPKFVEVTGYAPKEVIGRNPRLLKSGEMPAEVYADLWATITAGKEWRGELLNRRKSGDLYWEHASISPLRGPSGEITHYVGVKEEITERKRLERQLLQAQKMEAIGRLTAGIAHDFNNLLTVISGYTQLALERLAAEDPSRGDLEEIEKAASKAADLTSGLLSFSRRQFLKPVGLNLNDSVSGVLRLLRRLIGEDVEIVTRLEPDLGLVKADPTRIERVLLNLAVNARDAMPNGGTLTFQTGNVKLDEEYARAHDIILESGPYVMLSVSDTGCGMDETTRIRIFEPFFTTKDAGKGTGLGLSTAYGIVKQSGGYIWAYSEPNMGTTFKVYLPTVSSAEIPAPGPEEPKTLSGRESILLVEDNEALSRLCAKALERLGYTVLSARSVDEALQHFYQRVGGVDLLLADVILPASTGRRLAEHLTARDPGLKVLYMSGYPDETIARLGVVEHGIQFLQKPFTPLALARKVRETLDLENGQDNGR